MSTLEIELRYLNNVTATSPFLAEKLSIYPGTRTHTLKQNYMKCFERYLKKERQFLCTIGKVDLESTLRYVNHHDFIQFQLKKDYHDKNDRR